MLSDTCLDSLVLTKEFGDGTKEYVGEYQDKVVVIKIHHSIAIMGCNERELKARTEFTTYRPASLKEYIDIHSFLKINKLTIKDAFLE